MTLTIETRSIYALLFGLILLFFGLQQRKVATTRAAISVPANPIPQERKHSANWPNGQRIERNDAPAAKRGASDKTKTVDEQIADLDDQVVGAFAGGMRGHTNGRN